MEHQSTINENMPLRCLEYIGRIFENILEMRDRYARLLIKIPTPEFYVFYTGNESISAMQELKLSDAFIQKIEAPQLELIVKVINLNSKENEGFLESCPILKEYAKFVGVVKDFKLKQGKKGYDIAIRYCIKNNILKDYIINNAKEAWVGFLAKLKTDTLRILQSKILNKEWGLKVCWLQNMTII